MLQSYEEESSPSTSGDLTNKIKQLLQYQRFAVDRASFIGMSRDEAKEMKARISQISELLDLLHRLNSQD